MDSNPYQGALPARSLCLLTTMHAAEDLRGPERHVGVRRTHRARKRIRPRDDAAVGRILGLEIRLQAERPPPALVLRVAEDEDRRRRVAIVPRRLPLPDRMIAPSRGSIFSIIFNNFLSCSIIVPSISCSIIFNNFQ